MLLKYIGHPIRIQQEFNNNQIGIEKMNPEGIQSESNRNGTVIQHNSNTNQIGIGTNTNPRGTRTEPHRNKSIERTPRGIQVCLDPTSAEDFVAFVTVFGHAFCDRDVAPRGGPRCWPHTCSAAHIGAPSLTPSPQPSPPGPFLLAPKLQRLPSPSRPPCPKLPLLRPPTNISVVAADIQSSSSSHSSSTY